MSSRLTRWISISLVNLLIVAVIGVILRYKIAFSLPWINQKYLLHAHSHFAFSGWVTQTILIFLISYLSKQSQSNKFKSYYSLLIAHLISCYGMLFTFPIMGYATASIIFSTASIFIVYLFVFYFWKELNALNRNTVIHFWIKAAFVFYLISSLGTFALAWMMATKSLFQNWYLAAVYFFLHFQYNGWFFFACMGLFYSLVPIEQLNKRSVLIFWMFALSCVPAYFLSVLWMPLPMWMYILVVLSACVQVIAWILFCRNILQQLSSSKYLISTTVRRLILLSACAVSIKLLLQLGSTVPELSHLAYGFRSIVIAYLHLVLLGVITFFLLAFIFNEIQVKLNKHTRLGVILFVFGVLLNELVLMLQGIAALSQNSIPYTNETLFVISLCIFSGILILVMAQVRNHNNMNSSDFIR